MISSLVAFLEDIIVAYGALGLFLAAFIEEVIAPIPSTLVMMTGGFFFLSGSPVTPDSLLLLFSKVALPIGFGLTLGSFVWYGIPYLFGKPALERVGPWFGLSWKDVEKLEGIMRNTWVDNVILFIARALPVFPAVAVNVFCGLVRFPAWQYLLITLPASILRAFLVGFFGWQIGSVYEEYAIIVDRLQNFIFIFLLLAAGIFVLYRMAKKEKTV